MAAFGKHAMNSSSSLVCDELQFATLPLLAHWINISWQSVGDQPCLTGVIQAPAAANLVGSQP